MAHETFDLESILKILPQRTPLLLLDRVTNIQPRTSACGYKNITYSEPWFTGHFPGKPVFPGVLILEAFSQLVGVLAYASEPFDVGQKSMVFMGIDRARFRSPVVPGDRLDLEVQVRQQQANIWKCLGHARVGEATCAEAEVLVALME